MVKAFDLFELCTPVPESGCWIWLRAWNPDGYGKFTTKVNGEIYQCRAHRFIYEQLVGPIPEGMVLCHKCNTRCCVNPEHLYVGTQSQNVVQAVKQFRKGKLKESDIRAILASNESPSKLAKKYGVSYETIRVTKLGQNSKVRYLTEKESGAS